MLASSDKRKTSRHKTSRGTGPALNTPGLWCLCVLVGLLAGCGAVAFRELIAVVHNLSFRGELSFLHDATTHAPSSPWGALVILAPLVGGLGVAFLSRWFGPRAKGPGVAEVIEAIYSRRGWIRPSTAIVKMLASALSIGSGASVGREGPIVQIGAALGSLAGRIVRMPARDRIALVAAGAGGGVAAALNAPIGGVLFTVEVLTRRARAEALIPVAVSAVTATSVARLLLGPHTLLATPALAEDGYHWLRPLALGSYAGLGLLMGLASVAMIHSVHRVRDLFDRVGSSNPYLRQGIGMLLVGIIMYAHWAFLGHYYVQGVGYATIDDILTGTLHAVPLLLLLCGTKLLTTSLSFGAGASGGIFSPALFIGATFGAAFAGSYSATKCGAVFAHEAYTLLDFCRDTLTKNNGKVSHLSRFAARQLSSNICTGAIAIWTAANGERSGPRNSLPFRTNPLRRVQRDKREVRTRDKIAQCSSRHVICTIFLHAAVFGFLSTS